MIPYRESTIDARQMKVHHLRAHLGWQNNRANQDVRIQWFLRHEKIVGAYRIRPPREQRWKQQRWTKHHRLMYILAAVRAYAIRPYIFTICSLVIRSLLMRYILYFAGNCTGVLHTPWCGRTWNDSGEQISSSFWLFDSRYERIWICPWNAVPNELKMSICVGRLSISWWTRVCFSKIILNLRHQINVYQIVYSIMKDHK